MNAPVIVQYWHAAPPPEVKTLMDSWKAAEDEGFRYLRFDDEQAQVFIQEHFGDRALAAYRDCAVAAMKADLFRVCALLVRHGIYVDADTRRTGVVGRRRDEPARAPLMPLFERLPRGLLFRREGRVANGFIVVKRPQDELLRALLSTAIENIERRVSNNVYLVTGPGVTTKLFNTLGADHSYFKGFEFWTEQELLPYMRMVGGLPYKSGEDHWVNAQKVRSIFASR